MSDHDAIYEKLNEHDRWIAGHKATINAFKAAQFKLNDEISGELKEVTRQATDQGHRLDMHEALCETRAVEFGKMQGQIVALAEATLKSESRWNIAKFGGSALTLLLAAIGSVLGVLIGLAAILMQWAQMSQITPP